MKENLHDIDKLFKAAIEEHQEAPDSNVWEAIDKHLDKNSVIDISRKYVQLKRIAVVLLILLLGFGAYTLITWTKAKELSKHSITKNKGQSENINNLSQAQSAPDKIIAPNVIVADESPSGNTQKNHAGTPGQSENNTDKIITPGTIIIEKNDEVERSNKISEGLGNGEKTGHATAITQNQGLTNASEKTSKEIVPSAVSGRKVIIDKRKQNTNIKNADLGNSEDEIVNASSVKNENEVKPGLTNLPEIHPALIKVEPAGTYQKDILPMTDNLPQYLSFNTLQVKTSGLSKASSFTATLFYAPNISANHLKNNMHEHRPGGGGAPDYDGDREEIRHSENHQSSSTFGVLIDYNINKHWGLQSGASLSQKSIRIEPKTIYADLDDNGAVKYRYNCSSGYLFLSSKSVTNPAVGDSLQAFESTNTLQYLSIPLSVKYNYSISKIDLFATIGMAVNILTKGKIETELANGNIKEASVNNKINGLKSSYFGGNIGIGLAYNITGNIAISFLPSFNFALTSSTKDASVKTYPSTFGMGIGIRYKL